VWKISSGGLISFFEAGFQMFSPAPSTARILPTKRFPVRAFLLSGFPLLHDMTVRLLKKQSDIQLIGAHEYSALAVAEMIASGCDVLLADRAAIEKLVEPSRDDLWRSSPDLEIVLIEMEAGVADLLTGILHETVPRADSSGCANR
jgi:hypothetical protein